MQTFDLLCFLERQKTFSLKAFGPHGRAIGILNHVKKEIKEIEADPSDPMEWVDVVLLSLDRLWRMGKTPAEIVSFLDAKLTKNENREWPDWRTMSEDDAIEHDRSGESTSSEKELAMTIVNQLFDRASVPVELRQSINDECDAFVCMLLRAYFQTAKGFSKGAALITEERAEQIRKHGFDNGRDAKFYWADELRHAAIYCITLDDKWYPKSWDNWFRLKVMAKRARMELVEFHTEMNKVAGALLAADIDRLNSDDLKICTFIAERGNPGQGATFTWKVDLAGIIMPVSVPIRENFNGPAVGVAYPVMVDDGVQVTAIMPKHLSGWPAAGFSTDDDFAIEADGVKVYKSSRLQEISICGTPNADASIQPIN
ncbi:MAG: Eaa1 [Bacteroidetes bacterium]|nr:MAG: Eaa1 [Bacteroidota bacterium]